MGEFIEKGGAVSREEVWLSAWIGVARSSNCVRVSTPAEWADRCLEEFDKRFPQPLPTDGSEGR